MEYAGGCLCGVTRYTVTGDPVRVLYCHCNDCKKQTSAPYSVIASYAKEQVTLESSEFLKTHHSVGDSGGEVKRSFCGQCGSPIFSQIEALPDFVVIKAGSFDDASWLKPTMEIYTKDKLDCAQIDPSIDSFPGPRPG
jgi:hypothetical protein